MIRKSSKVILIFTLLCTVMICELNSQIITKTNYIVFTFERECKRQEIESYYWIIQTDSLNDKFNFVVSPLYIETFSQFSVDRCIKGDSISFYNNFEGVSDEYENEMNNLLEIIKTKRRKIQTISIKWDREGLILKWKNETISVYATPITGVFCNCLERHEILGSGQVEFKGIVYLPISNFSFNYSFWNTENSKIVNYADYSLIDFVKFTPYMYQDKNRVRARIRE